jgi:hypothetical protein
MLIQVGPIAPPVYDLVQSGLQEQYGEESGNKNLQDVVSRLRRVQICHWAIVARSRRACPIPGDA